METSATAIIGLAMIYAWIHFLFVQHVRDYKERTGYEKALTWVAIVVFVLFVIGTITS